MKEPVFRNKVGQLFADAWVHHAAGFGQAGLPSVYDQGFAVWDSYARYLDQRDVEAVLDLCARTGVATLATFRAAMLDLGMKPDECHDAPLAGPCDVCNRDRDDKPTGIVTLYPAGPAGFIASGEAIELPDFNPRNIVTVRCRCLNAARHSRRIKQTIDSIKLLPGVEERLVAYNREPYLEADVSARNVRSIVKKLARQLAVKQPAPVESRLAKPPAIVPDAAEAERMRAAIEAEAEPQHSAWRDALGEEGTR